MPRGGSDRTLPNDTDRREAEPFEPAPNLLCDEFERTAGKVSVRIRASQVVHRGEQRANHLGDDGVPVCGAIAFNPGPKVCEFRLGARGSVLVFLDEVSLDVAEERLE